MRKKCNATGWEFLLDQSFVSRQYPMFSGNHAPSYYLTHTPTFLKSYSHKQALRYTSRLDRMPHVLSLPVPNMQLYVSHCTMYVSSFCVMLSEISCWSLRCHHYAHSKRHNVSVHPPSKFFSFGSYENIELAVYEYRSQFHEAPKPRYVEEQRWP